MPRAAEILTPAALAFVADLQRRFGIRRDELLARRTARRAEAARDRRGWTSCPRPRRSATRTGPWPRRRRTCVDRRVEITGPPEPKMAINALNSGAKVWLADLEDANTPHWANVVGGQVTLFDAIRRRLEFTSPDGRRVPAARPTRRSR